MKKSAFLLIAMLVGLVGCEDSMDGQSEARAARLGVDDMSQKILNEGMTCDVQSKLRDFSEAEVSLIAQNVRASSDGSEVGFEENCSGQSFERNKQSDDVAIVQQAYTEPWQGESIEKTTNSGGVYGSIGRDGASLNWMCNPNSAPGTWYDPADYVISISYLANAYANRSKLKVRPNSWSATQALSKYSNQLSSRVYSDNSIRACVGYYWMTLFGAGYLFSSDFSFLLVP